MTQLIYECAADLGFSSEYHLQEIFKGSVGHTFEVYDCGQKFFLKIIPHTSAAYETRLQQIIDTQDFFAENEILVAKPFSLPNQKQYLTYKDNIILVYPFISGTSFTDLTPDAKETAMRSATENLGKIHLASQKTKNFEVNVSNTAKMEINFWDRICEIEDLIKDKKLLTEIDSVSLHLIEWKKKIFLEKKYESPISYENLETLIHGDYHEDNLLFKKNGEVKVVLDWDNCVLSSPGWELVYSLMKICFQDDFKNYNILKALAYYNAYSQHFTLTKRELEAGWYLWYKRETLNLWSLIRHYKDHDHRSDRFILNASAKLELLYHNIQDLTEQFLQQL